MAKIWNVLRCALLIGWLAFVSSGCTQAATPSPLGAWSVQWWTDFHEPGPWQPGGGPGTIASYSPDGYRLASVMPGVAVWSLHPTAYEQIRLAAHLEADPTPVTARGAYGLVCGYQSPQQMIVFALGSDGTYAVWQVTPKGTRPLHTTAAEAPAFRGHPAVRAAPQSNRMMVECRDTGLRLWVNGHLLLATETPGPKGQVGMWVRTPANGAFASWGGVFHDLTLWTWQRP